MWERHDDDDKHDDRPAALRTAYRSRSEGGQCADDALADADAHSKAVAECLTGWDAIAFADCKGARRRSRRRRRREARPAAKASLLAERLSACGEAAHTKPHAALFQKRRCAACSESQCHTSQLR